jgi:acyl-coenzyme A thioesterase PaaI-like protein
VVPFTLVGAPAAGAAAARFGAAKTTSALLRYLAPGLVGPFRAVPEVMPQADGDAFVRVEVFDEGADDLLIILGEVHVVLGR